MISIGRRAILTINILTVCLACASLAEYTWIGYKVFGTYRIEAVILLPLILLFVIRSVAISIIFVLMHGIVLAYMTFFASAVYFGDKQVSYLSGSTFVESSALVLSVLIIGIYLAGWAIDRLFFGYLRRFGRKS